MAMQLPIVEPEKLYTVEEFELMPEFNDNYELIDGRLFKKVGNIINGRIAVQILFAYMIFDRAKVIGEMVIADVNVKIARKYSPAPDISFWKAANRPPKAKGAAPRPDMCVEIWSDSDLNTKKKREKAHEKIAEYIKAGVELVWAINPDNQTVEIHRPGQTGPEILDITGELNGEAVIPGFKMPVKALFE